MLISQQFPMGAINSLRYARAPDGVGTSLTADRGAVSSHRSNEGHEFGTLATCLQVLSG